MFRMAVALLRVTSVFLTETLTHNQNQTKLVIFFILVALKNKTLTLN